jgi:hypothetical protein
MTKINNDPKWAEIGKKVRVKGFKKVTEIVIKLEDGGRVLKENVDGCRYWNVDALVPVKGEKKK